METPYHFYCNTQFTPETKSTDHFIVEDLLDFSNQDDDNNTPPDATFDSITGNSTDSSNLTVVDTCNSTFSGSGSGSDPHFTAGEGDLGGAFHDSHLSAGELCIPYDDLAELEWLSNLVEESFSSDDLQKLQLISGMKSSAAARETSEAPEMQQEVTRSSPIFRQEVTVPGKARSKRNRAVPCNWSSRLLLLSPTTSSSESDVPSNSSGKSMTKPTKSAPKKKELAENSDGRKCLHCATDKTPQWRTGPRGPKTLCNACGVRYKSGRLVPEYRPAASPTFMLTKHSNSHRKVMELRRQKEMQMSQHQQFLYPNALYGVSGGSGGGCEEYLIHHQTGPDFRQLI